MGKNVNRSQLAELLGVNLSTIDNWVREGCPFITRPIRQGVGQWEFSAGAVFRWRIERERHVALGDLANVDESEARRRKLAAEAGLAELELHLANGAAVKISDAERVWVQMVGASRARLLAIPSKLGPILAIEADPVACQAIAESAIIEALSELSGFDPEQQSADDEREATKIRVAEARAAITNALELVGRSGGSGRAVAKVTRELNIALAALAESNGDREN